MESNITKDIIFNYFAGTCTALQKNLIDAWIKEDDNRELFFEWLYEWEKTNVQYKVNVDEGLSRHRAWVKSLGENDPIQVNKKKEEEAITTLSVTYPAKLHWLLIAASFLFASIFTAWLIKDRIMYQTYETAFGEIKKLVLPDGSKVVLNANSIFRVPRFGFRNNIREVFLAGEASFEVIHTTDDKHFLVRTDKEMNIEVLGTEFDVYARPSESRVVLNTGKIQLHYSQGSKREKLMMKPGDLATMDQKGKLIIATTAEPQNFSAWKYHRFVFEDLAFRKICDRLEETFGSRIIIENPELAQQVISGSFTALDSEELLELLGEAGNFTFRNQGNQIIVSKNR